MSEVQKWGQDPQVNAKLIEIDQRERVVERARKLAAETVALSAPKIIKTLLDELDSDDAQVRLRAADILLSRLLPKVAAIHVEGEQDSVESIDIIGIRDSIITEFKKRR